MLYAVTSDISARFLRGQLEFLIDHGYEVAVGTRLSERAAAFDDGVQIHDLPLEREPSPVADLRGLFAVIALIRRVRPTIVNASTPKAALIGMLAAWLLRVPQRVYVVRGLRFETASGFGRGILRWLERLTTACATDVVYNSRSLLTVAERERSVRSGRGVVLAGGSGNGIDVDRFRDLPSRDDSRRALGLPPDADVVGFVGRLTRDKGVVDLVQSVRADDDTVLLLVGDFEPGDPVPSATQHGIETAPNIIHLPWVDDPRTIYPAMDLLVFPSYREGLPNVPLEAQLCGVPVIAYGSTGTIDAVFPGAPNEIVPTGDVDALATAIERQLHGPHIDGGPDDSDAPIRWVTEQFGQRQVWEELLSVYESDNRSAKRAP